MCMCPPARPRPHVPLISPLSPLPSNPPPAQSIARSRRSPIRPGVGFPGRVRVFARSPQKLISPFVPPRDLSKAPANCIPTTPFPYTSFKPIFRSFNKSIKNEVYCPDHSTNLTVWDLPEDGYIIPNEVGASAGPE